MPAPAPAPVAAAAPAPTTPIGIWVTEENKGNVRIEQCGTALCGYAVKSGEKILINMMPEGSKWTGRIYDPDSGRNYNSTIAMKGSNALRVQGCVFGGNNFLRRPDLDARELENNPNKAGPPLISRKTARVALEFLKIRCRVPANPGRGI